MKNKEETTKYYEGIILELEQSLKTLKYELETYGHRPHMRKGIERNIKDREEDIKHYKDKLKKYQNEGWASNKKTFPS